MITNDDVLFAINETGKEGFNEIQEYFTRTLGRHLDVAERRSITKSLQKNNLNKMEAQKTSLLSNFLPILPHEISICTAFTEDYEVGYVTSDVNRAYANHYGYKFQCDILSYDEMIKLIHPRLHCTWYKIHMIIQAFLTQADVKYVMWIDGDAVVINHDRKIEDMIKLTNYRELILSEDLTPACLINAGVLLFKRCEWTMTCLQQIWSSHQYRKYYNVYYYEQSAIISYLKRTKEGLDQVELFHSFNGGENLKLFAHVAVLSHWDLNCNVVQSYECGDNAMPSGGNCSNLNCNGQKEVDRIQVPGYTHEGPRYIFHAVGKWHKMAVIKNVLLVAGLYKVDYDEWTGKRLVRGKCGAYKGGATGTLVDDEVEGIREEELTGRK